MRRITINFIIVAILIIACWQLGSAAHIYSKAWFAQQLLDRAWAHTKTGEKNVRPWPWADTFPFAELTVERLGIRQIVLTGDSGRILAFGPGYNESSSKPGHAGITLISGHRDTHFAFLKDLKLGDILTLSTPGNVAKYKVEDLTIINAENVEANIQQSEPYLLLVTCYPFEDWVAGGKLRYLVTSRFVSNGEI